jgi:Helix-turn-helix domain
MQERPVNELLPHLVAVLRDARVAGELTFAHVAVRVQKKDRVGVSETSISRFERGTHWPANPDAFVTAYAEALGVEPAELWRAAVDRWEPTKPAKPAKR